MTNTSGPPNLDVIRRDGPGDGIQLKEDTVQRFIIERDIPGAAELTQAQLAGIAQKSNATMESLGVPYRWITSYVAGDKIYCIHEADDEDTIREHSRRGGFPATAVTAVASEFGPHTAELGTRDNGAHAG